MVLTEEKRDEIMQDFIEIFKARYGKEWREKLTTQLKPSPIYQIAEQRGVSISDVRKVRSQMLAAGQFIRWYETLVQPTPFNVPLLN